MTGIVQDLRYAIRGLRRSPGFTAVAVVTLALGIGANIAFFCLIDAVLLRPLGYSDPDRLVIVQETAPRFGKIPAGGTEFEEWRRSAQSFERMSLMAVAPVILTGADQPERLDAARVSPAFFPMLGVDAAVGRTFIQDEEVVGHDHAVILSDGLWRRRFGADASIVGRTIILDDEPYVVDGVLPPRFRFPRLEQLFASGISGGQPQLWLPFAITDATRNENSFAIVAKLKTAVSSRQAGVEIGAIGNRLVQQLPNPPQIDVEVIPLQRQITASSRDVLVLVWAAIALVLVIAGVNITNLLLSRSAARTHELAIRGALGASRRALFRHALLDSLTLAIFGGLGGIVVASALLPLLIKLAPTSVPRLDEVALDMRAIAFCSLLTLATGSLVGILPARRAARTALIETLRLSGRTATSLHRERHVMVVMQIALTMACLTATGLVIQSLRSVLRVNPGFAAEGILTVDVGLSPGRFKNQEARALFVRQALQQLEAIPGVMSVGFVNRVPFTGISMNTLLAVEGSEEARIPITERPLADIRSVDAGYFRTLGIPLLRGSMFQETDTNRAVAVLSEAMTRRAWPGKDPIGRRFRLSARPQQLIEVIGVVGNVRSMGFETPPTLSVYLPYWQGLGLQNNASFTIKTRENAGLAGAVLREAIGRVDRDVPIQTISTMEAILSQSVSSRRFETRLLSAFGLVASLLAALGIFAVMSYAVSQRSREFGIRMALGASRRSVQRTVLRNVAALVGVGLVGGVPLALTVGYTLRHLVFSTSPYSLAVLLSASGLIVVVAIAAGVGPARRAARVDPLVALRYE